MSRLVEAITNLRNRIALRGSGLTLEQAECVNGILRAYRHQLTIAPSYQTTEQFMSVFRSVAEVHSLDSSDNQQVLYKAIERRLRNNGCNGIRSLIETGTYSCIMRVFGKAEFGVVKL